MSENLTAGDPTTPDTVSPESDDLLAGPDPLLGSGSFIDPNNGGGNDSKEAAAVAAATSVENSPNDIDSKKFVRPTWLPEDWDMLLKKRTSGATLGTIDRYFIAPSGQRLRSKNEVMNFLQTGSKRKKPAPNSDEMTSENSGSHSKKKSGGKKKEKVRAFTYDFENPPEIVTWRLTNPSKDAWSPFVGDQPVPESTRQEWAAVFKHTRENENL